MNLIMSIVIQTANILGIFTDPFEFEGDYGPEVNPIRSKVFEQVVSKEALSKNLSDTEIRKLLKEDDVSEEIVKEYRNLLVAQAISEEKEYGPTFSQLITPELIEELKNQQTELQKSGFSSSDLEAILLFIEHYKDQKAFRFLRNNPPEILSLDKALKDKAAREGKKFDLPILGSTRFLEGQNSFELKKNLMKAVFNKETFASTKPQDSIKQSIKKLNKDYLNNFFGDAANNQDLEAFSSSAGQVFFYWMYQSLNLHLISADSDMIEQINKVKEIFATTLGDPIARAIALKGKLIASGSEVLFTQESDALVPQTLTNDGLFLPVDHQNLQDGTLVLLRSDLWEPDYEIIAIEGYEGFKTGRMNVILATQKNTGQKFLLASCHGHSIRPEDGRLQISLIMEKFYQLSKGDLQLLIGIDANTKTEEDVNAFREHLDNLGLVGTEVGPTTVKKRMVAAQHSKAGRFAIDEEDYLITLKPENGGKFQFSDLTVGFKREKPDVNQSLPNIDNPSDHYPVGATMSPF
ncbi:MAG: hypothetical protein Q8K60_03705 [Parachlamydiaceae bacterium]|nr:hypothetical protein [Parachlamydiaceae bacterium]